MGLVIDTTNAPRTSTTSQNETANDGTYAVAVVIVSGFQ